MATKLMFVCVHDHASRQDLYVTASSRRDAARMVANLTVGVAYNRSPEEAKIFTNRWDHYIKEYGCLWGDRMGGFVPDHRGIWMVLPSGKAKLVFQPRPAGKKT